MYLDFFSLKKFPFRITPDPSMFFPGGTDGPGVVLNALVYAVSSGEGIVKVVGEVGSGKTMLCRMLEERLPDNIEIVYLANPSLSARDIIYAIAFELDLDVDASTERLLVMHKLQDYLVKKHSEGGTVVVFIEEAQGMPIETLEEIRLLSNLETHRHKLMQIILFGQPELDKNLQGKNIRQLRERITHSFYLEPMNLEQTSDYLQYRMQAGSCPWPKVFTAKAEKLLNKASQGLTRRVNILADKSLMAAYATSSIQAGHEYGAVQQKILPKHVRAAIRDSGYGRRFLFPWQGLVGALAVLGLGAVLSGIYFTADNETTIPLALVRDRVEDVAPATDISTDTRIGPAPLIQAEEEPGNPPEVEARPELPVEDEALASIDPVEEISVIAPENLTATAAEIDAVVAETPVPATIEHTANLAVSEEQLAESPPEQMRDDRDTGDSVAAVEIPAEAEEAENSEIQIPQDLRELEDPLSELSGLIGIRARASGDWLQAISGKNAYTLQMASFPINDDLMLEEYLQLLSLATLIDETYLCLISGTSRLSPQWLVIHGDFNGLSTARAYIDELPAYSRRYEPFVRNSSSIACLNNTGRSRVREILDR